MSKNNKKNRTDGTITSSNIKAPVQSKSFNSTSNNINLKDVEVNRFPNQLE